MNYYKKTIDRLVWDYKLYKNFSFTIAKYNFIRFFIHRKTNEVGKKYEFLQHESVKEYLSDKYENNLNECIIKCNGMENNQVNISRESTIWIFWWQGIDDNTPKRVVECIESINKNKSDHSVCVITKDNIKEIIELPSIYYSKLKNGLITLTHFSDLLRVELLSKYGGIWSDASFFWTKPLPESAYTLPFYTLRHNMYYDYHVCKGLWTDGFICSGPNNQFMFALKDLFRKYWNEEDILICYLLIDCFISLLYENSKNVMNMVDNVPINNKEFLFFDQHGNEILDNSKYQYIVDNNSLFRIHFKRPLIEYQSDDITYYGQLIKDNL